MTRRRLRPFVPGTPWPTVLGLLVSISAVALGLRFGAAGLAGTIAIGLFALFVSAAIISARRQPTAEVTAAPAAPRCPGPATTSPAPPEPHPAG